jgi:hypothetical protein
VREAERKEYAREQKYPPRTRRLNWQQLDGLRILNPSHYYGKDYRKCKKKIAKAVNCMELRGSCADRPGKCRKMSAWPNTKDGRAIRQGNEFGRDNPAAKGMAAINVANLEALASALATHLAKVPGRAM